MHERLLPSLLLGSIRMGLGLAGTSRDFFLHHIVAVVTFGTDQAT